MMRFQFRNAFANTFDQAPPNFVWSDDGVLRTIAMQSYIYPAIAAHMGLYLVCELPADASFFRRDEVKRQIIEQRGYPGNPVILVEHENVPSLSTKEMQQLAKRDVSLSVLITYYRGTAAQQLGWLSTTFSPVLHGVLDVSRELLVVLPGQRPEDDPLISAPLSSRKTKYAGWWNFFEWGDSVFRELGAVEAPPIT